MRAFLIILLSCCVVNAHEWFDSECCGGSDCHFIQCDELSEIAEGVEYITPSGVKLVFKGSQIHPSKDGRCAVCYVESEAGVTPFCVYVQQGT